MRVSVGRVTRKIRTVAAHIERIVLAHLPCKLLPDPTTNRRASLLVEPSEPMDFSHNQLLLALLREDPA